MGEMQNRQVSSPSILSRIASNLTAMNSRTIAAQAMQPRINTSTAIQHYLYNQVGIAYNQALFTYNYTSTKGNIDNREVVGVTMRGKN